MQKLKILIVEDNKAYVESYQLQLSGLKDEIVFPLTIATTFEQALDIITKDNCFDLTFLDYLLNEDYTAGYLIEETREYVENYGRVVFSTVNVEEERRLRQIIYFTKYLLLKKPFTSWSLKKIINQVQQGLTANLDREPRQINIWLRNKQVRVIRNVYDILYIFGMGNDSTYYVHEDGKIVPVREVVGSIGEQLEKLNDPGVFLRVHNSYIVNTTKIKRIKKDDKRTGWLSFMDLPFDEKLNPNVARFSLEHENKPELFRILALKNIQLEDNR